MGPVEARIGFSTVGTRGFRYKIPNLYIELLLSKLPMPTFPWRAVQNGPNAFVIESFMDELANAAGRDPLGVSSAEPEEQYEGYPGIERGG